jgi:hypothetical protein
MRKPLILILAFVLLTSLIQLPSTRTTASSAPITVSLRPDSRDGANPGPYESVYVSEDDRLALSDIIQNSNDLMNRLQYDDITILLESITQVYVACFLGRV